MVVAFDKHGKRRLGVSYSRLSDPYKQADGDSETRQDHDFRAFCSRHNLTPSGQVYRDRLSGFKGHHRTKGRLGQLVEQAKAGWFPPGTVIVVEAWDRLGRLIPNKQIKLIEELLELGIDIGVCRLDDIFTYADFGTHKWTSLAVFVQLAYQESKQKSERVAASWQRRRQRARAGGRLLTGRLPAWLRVAGGAAQLVPERAAVIQRIFEMAAAGLGHARIVAALVKDGVPPFGKPVVRPGQSRSQFSGQWSRRYIALILRDR